MVHTIENMIENNEGRPDTVRQFELVIREALSAYAKSTLGVDRSIANELSKNARYVAEQYLFAGAYIEQKQA